MKLNFNDTKYQKERVNLAIKCLIDNGIEDDEAETVLEALCYILMDADIEPFFDSEGQAVEDTGRWTEAEKLKFANEGAEILAVVKNVLPGEITYTVDLLMLVRWMGRVYFKDPYDGNYEVRPSDIVCWMPKPKLPAELLRKTGA